MSGGVPSPPVPPPPVAWPRRTRRWSSVDIARAVGQPDPTPEQQAVIEAPLSPMLIVAGAGAGKTETMAARVVWLVANGLVDPGAVLGLTFTRKAAAELAGRVRHRLRTLARLGLGPRPDPASSTRAEGPTVATYHSYAGALVAEHGLRLGLEPQSRLLGPAAAWQLVCELVDAWDGPMDEVRQSVSTVVDAVIGLAGECAEHLVTPAVVDRYLAELIEQVQTLPRREPGGAAGRPYAEVATVLATVRARRQILPLVEQFSARKHAAGQLDFADQLAFAAQLAAIDEVAATERDRHRVVLLDEYQDTSHAQLVLLSRLYGDGHPVTAVGDPQQAIYGWRGASAGALEAFTRAFAPVRVNHLSTSWRNDRAILAAANTLSRPLRARSATALAAPDLRWRPDAGSGQVRVGWYDTVEGEAEAVADELAAVWAADEPAVAAGRPRRSVAVLCRTRHQIPPIEAALRARGLPVEVVGLGGLLATPEVADVVAVLQVLHDPSRGDALVRLLTGARWRLGPRDLHRLGELSRHLAGTGRSGVGAAGAGPVPDLPEAAEQASLVEVLDTLLDPAGAQRGARLLSPAGFDRAQRLAGQLRDLRRARSAQLPELVDLVVRATGLDVEVAAGPGRPAAAGGDARAHLTAFADVVADFADRTTTPTLGGLLAWLSAAEERERGLEPGAAQVSSEAVSVLTVHAAKGLEWDVVAVPGLSSGILPAQPDPGGWLVGLDRLPYPLRGDAGALPQWRWDTAATGQEARGELGRFRGEVAAHDLVEERRIAYVAFTRARSLLLATGHRWGDGRRPREVSPFLAQIAAGGTPADVTVLAWAAPTPAADNPRDAHPARAEWPVDPLGPARPAWEAGAALVRAAMAGDAPADGPRPGGDVPADVRAVIARWRADADALLAERARAGRPVLDVPLPGRLSATQLVALAHDPDALAVDLRRPVPRPVGVVTRRGTAFHAWLEARFARQGALMDLSELPGAADDPIPGAPDGPGAWLASLQEAFLASEWADRVPLAVEVPFEVRVGPLMLAGRADAVFTAAGGRFEVVDWKTGRPPGGAEARARAVQLAAYRLAWARLQHVPLSQVSAAFFYASTGQTVRPADLLDEAAIIALLEGLPAADDPP